MLMDESAGVRLFGDQGDRASELDVMRLLSYSSGIVLLYLNVDEEDVTVMETWRYSDYQIGVN